MFSSSTDRFYHGLSKRHTKLIDSSQVKINLKDSNVRQNSCNKRHSKSSRMFENKNPVCKKNTFIQTFTNTFSLPFKVDKSNIKNEFVPPLKFKSPRKYKLSSQIHFHNTSSRKQEENLPSELNYPYDKKINCRNSEKKQQVGIDNDQIGKKQNKVYGVVVGAKCKFKQKQQQSAMRKLEGSQFYQNQSQTDRIDDGNMKNLMNLIIDKTCQYARKSDNQPTTSNKQIVVNSQHKTKENKSLPTSNHNFQKNNDHQINSHNQQENPRKTNGSTYEIQDLKNNEEQSSKNEQQIFSVHQVSKQKTTNKTITNQQFYQQPSISMESIESLRDNSKKQYLLISQNQQKQPKQSQQVIEPQFLRTNKYNSKTDIEYSSQINSHQTQIEENKKKQTNPNKRYLLAGKNAKISKYAYQDQTTQLDQIEEIQLVCSDRGNKQKNCSEPKINKNKVEPQNNIKINQNQQIKSKVEMNKPTKHEERILKNNTIQSQKKKSIHGQKKEGWEKVMKNIQQNLNQIDSIGAYCQQTKKFSEEYKISSFNKQYNVMNYYLWQQIFYLRQNFREILTNKTEDLYEIPKQQLINCEPELQNYLNNLQKKIEKQNNKQCKKYIQKYHQIAMPDLNYAQKHLVIDKNMNYQSKCMLLFQKQFKEIQKVYKNSVQNEDINQGVYLERLCSIIQMYSSLKYLNNEEVEVEEVLDQVRDKFRYYQNYRHLMIR